MRRRPSLWLTVAAVIMFAQGLVLIISTVPVFCWQNDELDSAPDCAGPPGWRLVQVVTVAVVLALAIALARANRHAWVITIIFEALWTIFFMFTITAYVERLVILVLQALVLLALFAPSSRAALRARRARHPVTPEG